MPDFLCRDCGSKFSLSQSVIEKYPGWTPTQCRVCRGTRSRVASTSSRSRGGESGAPVGGPTSGIFTDGSSVPNPGPGGWGAVYVVKNEVIAEVCGYGGHTTNNRMELLALINSVDLVPVGTPTIAYSDSNLAVRTINEWAAGWELRGWKRKNGPVENLALVKKAYAAFQNRPELELKWIKAHAGFRWNEYADELANKGRTEGER